MFNRGKSSGYRLTFLAALLLLLTILAGGYYFQRKYAGPHTRERLVYLKKEDRELALHWFRPAKPNGLGLVYIISGAWYSSEENIFPVMFKKHMKAGYSVFAVVHSAQPKSQIPEMIQEVHTAVRFVRANAGRFQINPDKLGVTGSSAGGHLSLVLATGLGGSETNKPTSSSVQAVACFYPPTDFLNYGAEGNEALGLGPLSGLSGAFWVVTQTNQVDRQEYGREISPIYHVHSNLPPILIIHGTSDEVVPYQQAVSFAEKARAMGNTVELVTKTNFGHGWRDSSNEIDLILAWFDRWLKPETNRPAKGVDMIKGLSNSSSGNVHTFVPKRDSNRFCRNWQGHF
ncbi:MAG: alpha/beta hydrolase [Verrucomicrobiota bacterium]|nr:alpha/beta hydrolase [Verrucomicrobiota bacterium]